MPKPIYTGGDLLTRRLTIVLSLLLAALLCACTPLNQNVTDLLRAPALPGGQDELQKMLATYLGEEPQYQYPKEGDWRCPLMLVDLNGDGADEGVLLYSVPDSTGSNREKGNHVYVAILEKIGGEWTITQDIRGLSTDVASFEAADLLGDGTRQLIIGYATSNLNAKTFALYSYSDETLHKVYQFDYSRYEIADFTGRSGNDLVVISRDDQPGGLQLQYIPILKGTFPADIPAPVKLDANFVSCVGISPSRTRSNDRIIVIDGQTAADTGALASQFVYYSGELFYTVDDTGAMRGATARLSPLLKSADIDGNGIVEVPLRVGRSEVVTMQGDKRLEYVEWVDFTGEKPVTRQFGLLDSDRAVYIRLPDAWRDSITVVDGDGDGEWRIQHKASAMPLLSLQVIESGESPPAGSARVPGTISTYLVYGGSLPPAEVDTIAMLLLS